MSSLAVMLPGSAYFSWHDPEFRLGPGGHFLQSLDDVQDEFQVPLVVRPDDHAAEGGQRHGGDRTPRRLDVVRRARRPGRGRGGLGRLDLPDLGIGQAHWRVLDERPVRAVVFERVV